MYGKIGSADSSAGGGGGGDDDISLFLSHLLSSSSSSASSASVLLSLDRGKEAIPYAAGGGWEFAGKLDRQLAQAPSLAVPPPERAADDYEWESEEGAEASEEPAAKPAPTRTGPKRSRAAEVHNLSEKRRRSRINEKMKALQNLIPNSNKTDKASMLDEAIEYLKQLQLQVQMLSMRNGMSLHPMYMPGTMQSLQVPNMGSGFGTGDCPVQLNNLALGILPVGEESAGQTAISLPNQPSSSHKPLSLPNTVDMRKSTGVVGLDVSVTHQALFQLPTSATELDREESLQRQPHRDVHPASKLPEGRSSIADQKPNCLEGRILQQSNIRLVGPTDSSRSEILIQQLDSFVMEDDRIKISQGEPHDWQGI